MNLICTVKVCQEFSGTSQIKSTLERVPNAVFCCINGVFHELRHDSVMNNYHFEALSK